MAITLNSVSLPLSQPNNSPDTFSVTTSVGNLMIVSIAIDPDSPTASTVTGVTDNKGQTYTQVPVSGLNLPEFDNVGTTYIWYKLSSATGVNSLTVAYTPATDGLGVSLAAYDCSSTTGGALDTGYNAKSSQTVASLTASLSANAAGICVAVFACDGTSSTGTGSFTADVMSYNQLLQNTLGAHNMNGAGGTLSCGFSTNTSQTHWDSVIANFIESSGGGPVTPPGLLCSLGCGAS